METPEIPRFVVDEPQRSKKSMFGIALISFLLLSLPVGLFLVRSQTQISSQAAVEEAPILERSIALNSENSTVGVNKEIPVDVVIRSDNEFVNLASVKVTYDPQKVKVAEIISNQSQIANNVFFGKYWLSKGYDNEKGEVNLIAGTPKPGIQTNPQSNSKYLLAQIRFVTVGEGEAQISLNDEASLYKNSDATPVEIEKKNLRLMITQDAALPTETQIASYSGTLLPQFAEMNPTLEQSQIQMMKPSLAESYFYFRPLDIVWNASVEQIKSITLFLNGEPYGNIAENIPNNGRFTWTPSNSIALPMVVPANTYSLQLTGIDKEGKTITSTSQTPFGLISNPEGKTVSAESDQLKQPENAQIIDASKMLAQWGSELTADDPFDLNGDWVVNYLDWYLLRRALFVQDLVY